MSGHPSYGGQMYYSQGQGTLIPGDVKSRPHWRRIRKSTKSRRRLRLRRRCGRDLGLSQIVRIFAGFPMRDEWDGRKRRFRKLYLQNL